MRPPVVNAFFLRAALLLVALVATDSAVFAAATVSRPGQYSGYSAATYDGYKRTSQYVAMRDGTKIALDVYRPTLHGVLAGKKLPVVWMNTPYGRRNANSGLSAMEIVKYGYVVAVADMRGDYASFGKAVAESGASSPGNRNEWMPWARMDAYDITEWLAAQPWSDTHIGMAGCSAVGHSQWEAAAMAPPHLKAIFPMDAPSEYYDWGGITEMIDPPPPAPAPLASAPAQDARAVPVDEDVDGSMLKAASESHRGDFQTGYIPFRDSVAPGLRAASLNDFKYNLEINTFTHFGDLNKSRIPAYETTNFGEDMRVKLGVMVKLHNVRNPMKLIVAPGNHCNWTTDEKPNPANNLNITAEQVRWFDHWLKGVKNGVMDEPPVYYFTYNVPAEQAWQFAWQWPVPNQQAVSYYFGPGAPQDAAGATHGSLGTQAPGSSEAKDLYTVDYTVTPANENERAMTYDTPPLAADSTATGHPVVHLWISSTATDGDFLAFLADVAADGKVTRLPGTEDGKLRASHRALGNAPYDNLGLPYHRSFAADVKPLTPGELTELVFDMAPVSYVFKAGHRIRLIISCVEIPRHAGAKPPTPILTPAPVVGFYRGGAHASRIDLPMVVPVAANARIVRGKTTTAYITFPKTVDGRYITDVKAESVNWGGVPAAHVQVTRGTVLAEFDSSRVQDKSGVAIEGQFGSRYYYGELARFRAATISGR